MLHDSVEAQIAGVDGPEDAASIRRMTSQVNWALLGLLIERPDYKYRLTQRFESAFGDVLSFGSPSHIHTALSELKRRGLIERVPGRPATRMDTARQRGPRYRATPQGLQGFREHMLDQIWEDRRQAWLFARQLALLAGEPEVAIEVLEHRQRACLQETGRARSARAGNPRLDDYDDDSSQELADRLVSEDARLAPASTLPWIDYARAEFEALKRRPRR